MYKIELAHQTANVSLNRFNFLKVRNVVSYCEFPCSIYLKEFFINIFYKK